MRTITLLFVQNEFVRLQRLVLGRRRGRALRLRDQSNKAAKTLTRLGRGGARTGQGGNIRLTAIGNPRKYVDCTLSSIHSQPKDVSKGLRIIPLTGDGCQCRPSADKSDFMQIFSGFSINSINVERVRGIVRAGCGFGIYCTENMGSVLWRMPSTQRS